MDSKTLKFLPCEIENATLHLFSFSIHGYMILQIITSFYNHLTDARLH